MNEETKVGQSSKQTIKLEHGDSDGEGTPLIKHHKMISNSTTEQPPTKRLHCHEDLDLDDEAAHIKRARRRLIVASILCLFFVIGEGVGGILAGSLAILSDAAHLLSDFASFLIGLFALFVSNFRPTKTLSFGWHRAEVMGALLSVLVIWVLTGIFVYLGIDRIIRDDFHIDAVIMLITSACAIVMNICIALVLNCCGSADGHGHSHGGGLSQPNESKAKGVKHNINVRAAFIHVLGDLIQSVGVFVAALMIYFQPTWVIVDSICTFLFSVLVLITTYNIMKDILRVLMEATPKGINYNEVKGALSSISGVRKVHNLRLWALTMNKVACSVHIAIEENADAQAVLNEATKILHDDFSVREKTIQVEQFTSIMKTCDLCKSPKN